MKVANKTANFPSTIILRKNNVNIDGKLPYPESEDVYSKFEYIEDVDPEDVFKMKSINDDGRNGSNNEKDFSTYKTGGDLDVPGSELDDEYEEIGSEDEENNYYSIGGDDHDDLEEDKGE